MAVKKLVENGGNVSAAMREAKYKVTTARTPSKLTKSKAFPELLEKYLPDEKLLETHSEVLDAMKVVSAVKTSRDAGADSNDFIEVPDIPTRLRGVELGYKIKGKLNTGGQTVQIGQIGGQMKVEFVADDK